LDALHIERAIDAKHLIAIALGNLGHVALVTDNLDDAQSYFREALEVSTMIGATLLMLDNLVGLAGIWAKTGQEHRALEILGLVLVHPSLGDETRIIIDIVLKTLKPQFTTDELEITMAQGRTLQLDAVVDEILHTNPTNGD
jgi:hypothetical protein